MARAGNYLNVLHLLYWFASNFEIW